MAGIRRSIKHRFTNPAQSTADKWAGVVTERIQKTTNMLSCLTTRNRDPVKSSPPKIQITAPSTVEPEPAEQGPSEEDIKEWSVSLEKLLGSEAGKSLFREFLISEYSEENLLFWTTCEKFKTETTSDRVEESARLIYEDYISILSPKEVSVDAQVREKINKQMVQPSLNIFDEAQLQIFTLMKRDSYPRFLNSQFFKRYCPP